MAKKIFILVFLCIGLTASLSAQNDKPSPGGHPGPEDPRKEAVDAKKESRKSAMSATSLMHMKCMCMALHIHLLTPSCILRTR